MVLVLPFLLVAEPPEGGWGDKLLISVIGEYLEVLGASGDSEWDNNVNGNGEGDRDLACEYDGCLTSSNILKVLRLDGDFFTLQTNMQTPSHYKTSVLTQNEQFLKGQKTISTVGTLVSPQ